MKRKVDNFVGCLLGGALGDALGAPVESYSYERIIKEFGNDGICELQCGIYGKAEITDETQMTLFTAEGLLRAECRANKKEIQRTLKDTTAIVFRAYLRWLYTQGLSTFHWNGRDYDGWLISLKELYATKIAGTTCITALGKGIMGTKSKPVNDSKTCGGVMRIAPVGLFECREGVFELGSDIAAITHGHPLAYYSAGAMALLIHNIVEGMSIIDATNDILDELRRHPDTQKCIEDIEKAIMLSQTAPFSAQSIHQIGYGGEATEALAIGIYCSLCYPEDIIKAITLAVNHSGNSDSTGAIAGNIVGAYVGKEAIPTEWLQKLQLAKEIERMATELYTRHCSENDWGKRYPSW